MSTLYTYEHNVLQSIEGSPSHMFMAAAPNRLVRKNQKNLGDDFSQRFKTAIAELVQNGNYSRLVNIHANMDHRMHSMNGPIGTKRFLSWHRVYLLKFEAELRIVDNTLFVPYWDWAMDRTIPLWLSDLLPQGLKDLNGNPLDVVRFPTFRQRVAVELHL